MASSTPFCLTRSEVEDYLKQLKITFETHTHEPVFTVEKLMEHAKDMPGQHHKNLFLKDKKGQLYLLVTRHDRKVDLGEIGKALKLPSSAKLRLGPEDLLQEKLGVKQGSVNLFAIINDKPNEVKLLLDNSVLSTDPDAKMWFHPMENSSTTAVRSKDLAKFIFMTKHAPVLLDFDASRVTVVEK